MAKVWNLGGLGAAQEEGKAPSSSTFETKYTAQVPPTHTLVLVRVYGICTLWYCQGSRAYARNGIRVYVHAGTDRGVGPRGCCLHVLPVSYRAFRTRGVCTYCAHIHVRCLHTELLYPTSHTELVHTCLAYTPSSPTWIVTLTHGVQSITASTSSGTFVFHPPLLNAQTKLVVLVNRQTASAAEIVAGSIQVHTLFLACVHTLYAHALCVCT